MKRLAIALCLLAGAARAEEAPKITTAQSVEVEKFIAEQSLPILKERTQLANEHREAIQTGDKEKRKMIEERLSVLKWKLRELEHDRPQLWDRIQKFKKKQGLYWIEPAKGQKPEGKWAPLG